MRRAERRSPSTPGSWSGADGLHSLVAKAVRPEQYNEVPDLAPLYYTYWSGLPVEGFETYIRAEDGRGWAVWPTHDDLTCVIVGWPRSQFKANRGDVEGTYMKSFELAPEFAERIRAAKREERIVGTGDLPNFFRKPYGPGWALVGDAGYHKHPITGFGIMDAFRDAEAWRPHSTRRSPAAAPTTTRWPATSAPGTRRRCRCTSSPAISRRSSPLPPSCSS